jgi:Autographiviridae RNA polymerase
MTIPYNVMLFGMADHIWDELPSEVRNEIRRDESLKGATRYLAKKIELAASQIMPKVTQVRSFIGKLSKECTRNGQPLRWTNATGFPVSNLYYKPNVMPVYLPSGREFNVADGYLKTIKEPKASNSAAPNFIHSMDAAHLASTVNGAVEEGITNILPIHDSYSGLAPEATRFNQVIRAHLGLIHLPDQLRYLRDRNVKNPDDFPLPDYGKLDPQIASKSEYCWS